MDDVEGSEWWDSRRPPGGRSSTSTPSKRPTLLFVTAIIVNVCQFAVFGLLAAIFPNGLPLAAVVATLGPVALIAIAWLGWAAGGRKGRALVVAANLVGLAWTPTFLLFLLA